MFAACVVNHGRTYDATFGYLNKNIGAVVIPIGPHNRVSPGPADQGQIETFAPGFVGAAFTIHGISVATPVTWTLSYRGQVRSSTATPTLTSKCLSSALNPVADLALTKSASPRTVQLGADVRFTITVRNTGSAVVDHPRIIDSLSGSQLAIISATTTLGSCQTNAKATSSQIDCRAPTLAPGQSFTILITARAISPGPARDRATIAAPAHDPTPGDNSASATVDINQQPPTPSGLG
jgi:uncharacterized repeat protein (TIGR01451 family)